jgi:hypothetical protein
MKPQITFKRVWSDEDLVELRIESSDGASSFTTQVYAAHETIRELLSSLETFKTQVHGGLYDVRLGEFGPEYANGAFRARLHFQSRGKLHISVHAQSEFKDFGNKNIASEASLYLVSEPALLDRWLEELREMAVGKRAEAVLECA